MPRSPSRPIFNRLHLCYIDESGTAEVPGTSRHFVLAGLAVPIEHWRRCEQDISKIKRAYELSSEDEVHTGWILRKYVEQQRIPEFETLSRADRRVAVERVRNSTLLAMQKDAKSRTAYRQAKKNYTQTRQYVHLTLSERRELMAEIADCIAGWEFATLFAECIDKVWFNPAKQNRSVDEQAFEQLVSRFERYLESLGEAAYGMLIHDNNETIASRHTSLMKHFHENGTLWVNIRHIIETPLFVDSSLTSMVQVADLCAYALRRYLENEEEDLFDRVFVRAHRKNGVAVSVRHFSDNACRCKICRAHRFSLANSARPV